MKSTFYFLLFLAIILPTGLLAQAPPGTEIFLAPISQVDGQLQVGAAKNITARAGYDNQPAFNADASSVYFTRIPDTTQADIYRYDIASGKTSAVIATAESEYSPTPRGNFFSTVRVESDGTQRLWGFDIDGQHPRLILKTVQPVGYHAWITTDHVALFVLGEPHKLLLANTRTGRADSITNNIGRSIHKIPGKEAASFTQPASDSTWWIRSLDINTREVGNIVETRPQTQDYAWTADGSILLPTSNQIYYFKPGESEGWQLIKTFEDPEVKGLYRIAVSPKMDWVALVGSE